MGPCCVEGCKIINDDTHYFEFPTSRALRRKWLEVIKLPRKVPLGAVVCSNHFSTDDYETVRGKPRLKRKVVPTLCLVDVKPTNPPEKSPDLPKKCKNSRSKSLEVKDEPDSTTEVKDTPKEEEKEIETKEESEIKEEICKVVSKRNSVKENVDSTPPTDPKQPPDFEEMITNYQIKNKPNAVHQIEIEVPPVEKTDTIVVDDRGDAPPVFIEINVDKDNPTSANEECLMVLESVQVEVDPTALMLEREEEELRGGLDFERGPLVRDVVDFDGRPAECKEDPISLLTSSDESDVILEEPHIDTVEVSDETDEDDVPLVKLVRTHPYGKTPSRRKKHSKKPTPNIDNLKSLTWHGAYDFYCVQCHFTTSDSHAFLAHKHQHSKIIQICPICNYTTASKTQFARHTRKHKEEKKFKCHLCDYKARHNMSLLYHLESHNQDKKIKSVRKGYKCERCGFKSKVHSAVRKHVSVCGSAEKKYSCDSCMYATKRRSDLKRHWLRKHKDTVVEIESDSEKQSEVMKSDLELKSDNEL